MSRPVTPCDYGGPKCRIGADDPRHGTGTAYHNWGCRCAPCKAAGSLTNAAQTGYRRLWGRRRHGGVSRAEYLARRVAEARPCGTHAAYARHRRNGEACDECRAAEAAYHAAYRARLRAANDGSAS